MIKHVINDNGGTATAANFSVTVTGSSPSPATFPGAESPGTNVGLGVGAYSVEEGAHAGYTETKSADCTGSIAIGETKTCTITNDDQPAKLIVIKHVINDNGGSASRVGLHDHGHGDGAVARAFAGAERPARRDRQRRQLQRSSEGAHAGYTETQLPPTAPARSPSARRRPARSRTTTSPPKLIVIKHVINDNGGTADGVDFTIDGQPVARPAGDVPGRRVARHDVAVDAGTYGVDGGRSTPATPTTLRRPTARARSRIGETKTCTITNDDIAREADRDQARDQRQRRHARRRRLHDDGRRNGRCRRDLRRRERRARRSPSTPARTASPRARTPATRRACSADCAGTIALGETKTCTITNDDIAPKLIVIKHVINDNGGTQDGRRLHDDGRRCGTPRPASRAPSRPGRRSRRPGRPYGVDEGGARRATPRRNSADCNGTIALGETKTCTITNDDIAPKLHLRKVVVNDNGGTKTVADFTLTADGTGANDCRARARSTSGHAAGRHWALSETSATRLHARALVVRWAARRTVRTHHVGLAQAAEARTCTQSPTNETMLRQMLIRDTVYVDQH